MNKILGQGQKEQNPLSPERKAEIIGDVVSVYRGYLSSMPIETQQYSPQEWGWLIDYISEQNIFTFIFPELSKQIRQQNDTEMMAFEKALKGYWMGLVFDNRKNCDNHRAVFDKFTAAGIDVLMLKGLSCSVLYPEQERRIMTDLDLFIHEGDTRQAIELLLNLGCKQQHDADCEYEHTFEHPEGMKVELHYHLTFYKHLKKNSLFEKAIWENKQSLSYGGFRFPVMSYDCQVVYLLMHMAKHIVWDGIDLRQLSDLKLLAEKHGAELHWEWISESLRELNLHDYAVYTFELCVDLLGMGNNPLKSEVDQTILLKFKRNLLEKGEHDFYRNVYSRYLEDDEITESKLINIMRIMFPKPQMLPVRYSYAKKWWILTPAAWIHRWVVELLDHRDRVIGLWKSEMDSSYIKQQRELMGYFGIEK